MIDVTDPSASKQAPERTHELNTQRRLSTLVNSRFTIAGLYVAAIGFLASAVLDNDATWIARAGGSLLASWLTLCLWILELRSRALFTNIAHRAIDIEHRTWGLTEQEWYVGLFSRQYKEPPNWPEGGHLPRRSDPDRPTLGWSDRPLSKTMARWISHSYGTRPSVRGQRSLLARDAGYVTGSPAWRKMNISRERAASAPNYQLNLTGVPPAG